jgi:hypothetical protein
MHQLFNESEQLVYDICRKSFLSLWSYANPLGKNSKELCDTLIVCDPDIIIISVKDVRITDSDDISIDWKRWRKRAIDDSANRYMALKDGLRAHPTSFEATEPSG